MTTDLVSVEALKALIRHRDNESVASLESSGGPLALAKLLGSSTESGLCSSDVVKRRESHGANLIAPPSPRTYLSFLLDAFRDVTVIVLCLTAVFSLILAFTVEKTSSSYAEGVAILVAIIVVTNVTAGNDWRKQRQFLKLSHMVDSVSVRVVRDGQHMEIPVEEVVVGEVVLLTVGDILCADGLILEGSEVRTDESALTGEPKLLEKTLKFPFLLSGTKVMEGEGRFLVIAVGRHSEAGQIRVLVQGGVHEDKTENPKDSSAPVHQVKQTESDSGSSLGPKLEKLAIQIGKVGTIAAGLCLIIMIVRYCILKYAISNAETECLLIPDKSCADAALEIGSQFASCASSERPCCMEISTGASIRGAPCGWYKQHLTDFLGFLITAITILVVAVPEGLPLAVTLSLAFSVVKMQKDNNLVKHLDACETMGSATTICSDKTGTLTKNRMTVVASSWAGSLSNGLLVKPPASMIHLLSEGLCLNSVAEISMNPITGLFDQTGNKTDCALLGFLTEIVQVDYKQIRGEGRSRIVKLFPFSSARKRASVVVSQKVDTHESESQSMRVYVKGASEMVFGLCTRLWSDKSESIELTNDHRVEIETIIASFASRAMRTICLAFKEIDRNTLFEDAESAESNLTLLGVVGIEDPLRDEVPSAILRCHTAGVDVRMVTGDNLNTAIAIAKGCNILRVQDLDNNGNPLIDRAMTGPEFRARVMPDGVNLDQIAFDQIWPHLRVLARSSPTDKHTLVTGLMESQLCFTAKGIELGIYPDRQVVAVTGDGTNDAPALKKADIGFAMGVTGTQVAKDAADIILLDDNFSSIVKACEWGRNVYENISKFLQFQLTVNIVAISLAVLGAIRSSESPLKPVQMLWVNLIMDSLASLALATEAPSSSLLNRGPYGRNQSIVSREMIWNMAGNAAFQYTVLLILLFRGPSLFDIPDGSDLPHSAPPSVHYTIIFNAFVFMQLANQINMRKLHHEINPFVGLFGNRFFLVIALIELAAQILIIFYGGAYFKVTRLTGIQWLVCVLLGLAQFPVQIAIVMIARFSRRWLKKKKAVQIHLARSASKESERPVSAGGVIALRTASRKAAEIGMIRMASTVNRGLSDKEFANKAKAYRSQRSVNPVAPFSIDK